MGTQTQNQRTNQNQFTRELYTKKYDIFLIGKKSKFIFFNNKQVVFPLLKTHLLNVSK